MSRIVIDCLRCGHCASLEDERLAEYGLPADAPLATLTRRLRCGACGSRAVAAVRLAGGDDQVELLCESPPVVPKE